jgi:hypothetical protein
MKKAAFGRFLLFNRDVGLHLVALSHPWLSRRADVVSACLTRPTYEKTAFGRFLLFSRDVELPLVANPLSDAIARFAYYITLGMV